MKLTRRETVAKSLMADVAGVAVAVVVAVVVRIGNVQSSVAQQMTLFDVIRPMMLTNAIFWKMTGPLALMMTSRPLPFRVLVVIEVDRNRGVTATAGVLAGTDLSVASDLSVRRSVASVVRSVMIVVAAVSVLIGNVQRALSGRIEASVLCGASARTVLLVVSGQNAVNAVSGQSVVSDRNAEIVASGRIVASDRSVEIVESGRIVVSGRIGVGVIVVRSAVVRSVIGVIAIWIVTSVPSVPSGAWMRRRIMEMKSVNRVVVVSVAVRVARLLASLVKTVVVVRHCRWRLSTRIYRPGRMRLGVCHCEHRPKIMLGVRKIATVIVMVAVVMVAVVVRVADRAVV